MKRFLALFLACACLMANVCAVAESMDYTVATKLVKQLAAGSGFSGALTLEADTESFSTQKPIVLTIDYIFVRPETVSLGEHRADITLMDGETALTSAHVQVLNGEAALQADLIGPDWYALSAGDETSSGSALISTLFGALAALQTTKGMDQNVDEALENALEAFTTRIDIWIEGYRQNAILGKLDDGTSTMEVNYAVAPSAVKAQVKQMVFDLLSDPTALGALKQVLGEEMTMYLEPRYQSWYFDSIEALPLAGDLAISRTVALTGETLALNLSLPMYDAEHGQMTLSYSRARGEGDLPDDNVIRMQSEKQTVELKYQEYSSMTGVEVMQGTLVSEPAADFTVSDENEAIAPVAVSFTLKQEEVESKDEQDRDVHAYNATLTLSPMDEESFQEIEMVLASKFVSEERKSAATDMSATLTISSADEAVELTLEGKSRKKWEPEALSAAPIADADWSALLPGAGVKALTLLTDFIKLPEAE